MSDQHSAEKKTAGALDIRNVIGALLALYGVILLLTAAFRSDAPTGTNNSDNWWGGVALLVVGVAFLAWARWKPIVVEK